MSVARGTVPVIKPFLRAWATVVPVQVTGVHAVRNRSHTSIRTYAEQPRAIANASFAALIANPARGSFTMPSTSAIVLYAPGGHSAGVPLVTLSNGESINSPSLSPRGRTLVGPIDAGTVVTVGTGLLAQLESAHGWEWKTICEG
jgi:hypothetical protein